MKTLFHIFVYCIQVSAMFATFLMFCFSGSYVAASGWELYTKDMARELALCYANNDALRNRENQ